MMRPSIVVQVVRWRNLLAPPGRVGKVGTCVSAALPANPTTLDLRLGDCLAGMATLPADSVDLVVTSPPYNLDIAYASFRDDAPREMYLDWCGWAAEVRRVLKPGGSFS